MNSAEHVNFFKCAEFNERYVGNNSLNWRIAAVCVHENVAWITDSPAYMSLMSVSSIFKLCALNQRNTNFITICGDYSARSEISAKVGPVKGFLWQRRCMNLDFALLLNLIVGLSGRQFLRVTKKVSQRFVGIEKYIVKRRIRHTIYDLSGGIETSFSTIQVLPAVERNDSMISFCSYM